MKRGQGINILPNKYKQDYNYYKYFVNLIKADH